MKTKHRAITPSVLLIFLLLMGCRVFLFTLIIHWTPTQRSSNMYTSPALSSQQCLKNDILVSECSEDMCLVKNGSNMYLGNDGEKKLVIICDQTKRNWCKHNQNMQTPHLPVVCSEATVLTTAPPFHHWLHLRYQIFKKAFAITEIINCGLNARCRVATESTFDWGICQIPKIYPPHAYIKVTSFFF